MTINPIFSGAGNAVSLTALKLNARPKPNADVPPVTTNDNKATLRSAVSQVQKLADAVHGIGVGKEGIQSDVSNVRKSLNELKNTLKELNEQSSFADRSSAEQRLTKRIIHAARQLINEAKNLLSNNKASDQADIVPTIADAAEVAPTPTLSGSVDLTA